MQTLIFNTKTKTVVVYENQPGSSKIIHTFDNVPTVVVESTYYEVKSIQNIKNVEVRVPVARFPISNTNMLIEN